MRRSASLVVLVAVACGLLGVASASSTASRRYEASGDPVLACALNETRPSAVGACFPVPSDAWEARIRVQDDTGSWPAFRVEFTDAAGLPVDPVAHVQSTVGGLVWGDGYPFCGYGNANVPRGAAYMRVRLVESSAVGCGTATSGLIGLEWVPWFGYGF